MHGGINTRRRAVKSHFSLFITALPIATIVFTMATIIATYLISTVITGHIKVYFLPMISQTGGVPPESCVFTFGMSLTAFSVAVIAVCKHFQLKLQLCALYDPIADTETPIKVTDASGEVEDPMRAVPRRLRNLNNAVMVSGLSAALFLLLVASLPVGQVSIPHNIVALGFFVSSTLYSVLMVILIGLIQRTAQTVAVPSIPLEPRFFLFRAVIVAFAVFSFVMGLGLLGGRFLVDDSKARQMVFSFAALFEYLFVIAFAVFNLTFARDFRSAHFKLKIRWHKNFQQSSVADIENLQLLKSS